MTGPPDTLSKLITLREAAALAGVSDPTINKWARDGRLGTVRYREGYQTRGMIELAALERLLGAQVTPQHIEAAVARVAAMNARFNARRRSPKPSPAVVELSRKGGGHVEDQG